MKKIRKAYIQHFTQTFLRKKSQMFFTILNNSSIKLLTIQTHQNSPQKEA